MDKIRVRQLKVDAVIGIHDWEKAIKQPVLIDLDLSFDSSQAAKTDDIKDALDYFAVRQRVTLMVSSSRFELVETLANKVAEMLLQDFPCQKVKLALYKPDAIANAQAVGIKISRSRKH